MNCSVYGAFFCESNLLRNLSRGCFPSTFFSGVLKVALLELPSCQSQNHSCGLLGLLASELSEVEVPSPLLSSGCWSGACLLSRRWSSERALLALLNAVRGDTICW